MDTANARPARDLSLMIDVDRARERTRRSFSGALPEIVGELLQNSQRACAHVVRITTHAHGFTWSDDGHGIHAGVEGWHTLLALDWTSFDNPTIESQDPIGVGMQALLAHGQVEAVTFRSGEYRISIDTQRWWTDRDYYTSWFERLEAMPDLQPGFVIEVRCAEALVTELLALAAAKQSPFRGYARFLSVTLNRDPVDCSVPDWVQPEIPFHTLDYQGCALRIGYQTLRHRAIDPNASGWVCWYGQLIRAPSVGKFGWFLEVTTGRPVNPTAPTRQGIIEDDALHALLTTIGDTVHAWLLDAANRAQLQPAWITALYTLRPALRTIAPYAVLKPYAHNPWPDSCEDIDGYGDAQIFTYDALPLALDGGLWVWTRRYDDIQQQYRLGWHACEYGVCSFLPFLPDAAAWEVVDGNRAAISVQSLFWRPGPVRADGFNEPGAWGLASAGELDSAALVEPTQWTLLTGDDAMVYAFNETASYDVDDVDFVVGCSGDGGGVRFLERYVWAGWYPDDENYHGSKQDYDASCRVAVRRILGDAVAAACDHDDLRAHLPTPSARIVSVTFHYPPDMVADDGRVIHARSPNAVTATNQVGEQARLRIID